MSKILLYHGVTDWRKEPRDGTFLNYNGKHIDLFEFERQMEWLSKNKRVVKLTDWIQYRPKDDVAITFDDSYENLYHNAVPVLKKYNLPATFFISTGFVDDSEGKDKPFPTNRFYWTDFIDYFVNYSNEEKAKLDVYGKEYNLKNDEGKIHFVEDTKEYLKNCSPKKRDEFLNMFKKEFEGFGFDADYDYPDIQNLSWEQIKEIDENPLFDIGGHTHNHEIMSYLSDAELASEIGTCLEQLEKNLGRKIYLFSYPEGQRKHYNKKVIQFLQDCNISICPSAIPGDNNFELDNFNLKRIMVGFNEIPFPFEEYYDEIDS
jgi:peptidoglycan/xylan/chitin deacetylase (PgdA/CDA1 family)